MEINLNFRSKKALGKQVQSGVEALIKSGSLLPGEQLPTVRDLADRLEINFNTVARAYRALDEAGWITTRQGRGTYVLEPSERKSIETIDIDSQRIEQFIHTVLSEANRLGISHKQLQQSLEKITSQANANIRVPNKRKRLPGQKKPTRGKTLGSRNIGDQRSIRSGMNRKIKKHVRQ